MIERIIILSLCSIAICYTTWDGQIFGNAAKAVEDYIGEFWSKPLFACYVCATLWWSLVQCAVYGWPLYLCLPAMGLSAVISQLSKE